jgi:hypothetical protein
VKVVKIGRALRWTAIAIAVLGLVDPPLTLDGRTRPSLSVIVQDGSSMELPAGIGRGSRRTAAEQVFATLRDDLRDEYEVVRGFDSSSSCLVVVGDRYPEELLPEGARISTVTVSAPLTPHVRIAAVDAPRAVPPGTTVPLDVTVEATGVRGATGTLIVRDLGAEVARASHQWPADRPGEGPRSDLEDTWTAHLTAVPVGEPPFRFDVDYVDDVDFGALLAERTSADHHAVVRVEQAPRLRVLVFEGRPSWSSAFVRRALESDPRFEVSGLNQVSPRAAVRTGASPALPERPEMLDGFDTIVVGGVDGLTVGNISVLERFMTERGGAVALLPDARPPGAIVRRMLAGIDLRERLLDRPAPLTAPAPPHRLDASELLEARDLPAGATVLARGPSSDQAVVWTLPRGEGRLLFSGALDSWRSRADADVEFDRFWRSAISGLALAARPAIDVKLFPSRPASGERVRVEARVRRLERERLRDRLSIAAALDSDPGEPVRLWPDAPQGTFTGSFVAGPAGQEQAPSLTVTLAGGQSGSARLTIDNTPRDPLGPSLALLAESHAGVNVTADDLATLERHVRATVPPQAVRSRRYPMRAVWWLVPFTACLSGEWWLRRRAGRR